MVNTYGRWTEEKDYSTYPKEKWCDYDYMEHRRLGTTVEWENEKWYVDNTDENFKDDGEETSLFLLFHTKNLNSFLADQIILL